MFKGMGIVELEHRLLALRSLPPPIVCRDIREGAGVSLGMVARAVGVSRTAVFNWETGQRRPSAEHLPLYLEALTVLSASSAVPPLNESSPAPQPSSTKTDAHDAHEPG